MTYELNSALVSLAKSLKRLADLHAARVAAENERLGLRRV